MGPEDLPHGVTEPGPSASGGTSKIARILMQKGWEHRFSHIVAYYEIAVRGADVAAESRRSLPKRSVCIRQLSFSSEEQRECHCPSVKGIFRRYLELRANG